TQALGDQGQHGSGRLLRMRMGDRTRHPVASGARSPRRRHATASGSRELQCGGAQQTHRRAETAPAQPLAGVVLMARTRELPVAVGVRPASGNRPTAVRNAAVAGTSRLDRGPARLSDFSLYGLNPPTLKAGARRGAKEAA